MVARGIGEGEQRGTLRTKMNYVIPSSLASFKNLMIYNVTNCGDRVVSADLLNF